MHRLQDRQNIVNLCLCISLLLNSLTLDQHIHHILHVDCCLIMAVVSVKWRLQAILGTTYLEVTIVIKLSIKLMVPTVSQ